MNFIGKLLYGFRHNVGRIFNSNAIYGATSFNNYSSDREKLVAVLSNPAMLKVVSLQCDMFSQGKIFVKGKDGNVIENDPFLDRIRKPNPLQSESQFLWDFMFWNMLGTSNCYIDSRIVTNEKNKFYFLEPQKIQWPRSLEKDRDKLVFSDATLKERAKTEIIYRYDDGTTFQFPLDRLLITTDLTNGIGNFYKGPSRIDALFKIITNSEHALDSKNINVRYTGKFLVGSSGALNSTGMKDDEKADIRDKMDSDQTVWPVKTMVEIKRFVENMQFLALDEAYLKDYFLIGNMYNIPRDVLEAYNSSTFENQEKARMAHVSYTLQPKGEDFMDGFEDHFGYTDQGKNITISWDHLPFMKVFQADDAELKSTTIDNLDKLLTLGVSVEQANSYLDTSFEIKEPDEAIKDNASPETLAAQAALRGSVGGVQGILAVQASVAAGTTTYEAALSILTIVYGFTEEQATDLLGEPEQTEPQGSGEAEEEEV